MKNMLVLKSIREEADDCRKAWARVKPDKDGHKYGVHIHHEDLVELTSNIENRIDYILTHKHEDEQALRLRLMRPISKTQYAEFRALEDKVYELQTSFEMMALGYFYVPNDTTTVFNNLRNKLNELFHKKICKEPNCTYVNWSIFP